MGGICCVSACHQHLCDTCDLETSKPNGKTCQQFWCCQDFGGLARLGALTNLPALAHHVWSINHWERRKWHVGNALYSGIATIVSIIQGKLDIAMLLWWSHCKVDLCNTFSYPTITGDTCLFDTRNLWPRDGNWHCTQSIDLGLYWWSLGLFRALSMSNCGC